MNKYKTELFDVTFNEPTGQEGEHVTITHRKHDDYLDMFDLGAVCTEVDILLQNGAIDAVASFHSSCASHTVCIRPVGRTAFRAGSTFFCPGLSFAELHITRLWLLVPFSAIGHLRPLHRLNLAFRGFIPNTVNPVLFCGSFLSSLWWACARMCRYPSGMIMKGAQPRPGWATSRP